MPKKTKYYPDFHRLSENRSMSFSDISLSFRESFWLFVSARRPISSMHAMRLIDLGFVDEIRKDVGGGGMPVSTDLYRISTRGIAYQNFAGASRTKYWITTFIALAALIKSFMPEILELWAWLSKR